MDGIGQGTELYAIIDGQGPFVDHFSSPWTHHRRPQNRPILLMHHFDEA